MRAEDGFDLSGVRAPLPAEQVDQVLGLFVEYGLTDRITLQVKGDWQDGEDAFVDYQGRGPVELGVRVNVWRDDWTVLSIYAGYAWGGDARNAVYAHPGAGDSDWDLRVHGADGPSPGDGAFVEVQAARRLREGLPDETRVDLTAGAELAPGWSVLNQVFAGRSEEGGRVGESGDLRGAHFGRLEPSGRMAPDRGRPQCPGVPRADAGRLAPVLTKRIRKRRIP